MVWGNLVIHGWNRDGDLADPESHTTDNITFPHTTYVVCNNKVEDG